MYLVKYFKTNYIICTINKFGQNCIRIGVDSELETRS